MAQTPSNLIMGNAQLYVGALGAAEPASGAVATAPASGVWTEVGYTEGGLTITHNVTTKDLEVDQTSWTPETRIVEQGLTVETNLSEATLANLLFALNGGTVVTGVGASVFTPTLSNSGLVTYSALIIDGMAPGGFRRRVIIRKVANTADVKIENKRDTQVGIPVTLKSYLVSGTAAPFVYHDGS